MDGQDTDAAIRSAQREQRIVLAVGIIVAAVPVALQIIAAGAVLVDAAAFPRHAPGLTDPKFWPIQIVLIAAAAAGNAFVDVFRRLWSGGALPPPALAYFFALLLFFLLLSVMLSLTFLDEQIGWAFLAGMSAIGAANLAFSYQLALNSVPTSSAEI